jgi:hypothetical protein
MLFFTVCLGALFGFLVSAFFVEANSPEGELATLAFGLAGIIVSISMFSVMGFI